MIKNHFEDEFEFSHAGDEDNQQNILADIIPPIYSADIVLADLTGLNANVMYELGIAHSFKATPHKGEKCDIIKTWISR